MRKIIVWVCFSSLVWNTHTHTLSTTVHPVGPEAVNSPRLWRCCWRCSGQQMEAALWEAVLCWDWLKLCRQPWRQEVTTAQWVESQGFHSKSASLQSFPVQLNRFCNWQEEEGTMATILQSRRTKGKLVIYVTLLSDFASSKNLKPGRKSQRGQTRCLFTDRRTT